MFNRLGLKKIGDNFFVFLFGQKFVHILVVSITALLLIINLSTETKAGGLTESAHKTILAELIKSEFSEFEEDEQLIIETFDKEAAISQVQQTYLDNLGSFRSQPKTSLQADSILEAEEESLPTIQNGGSIVRPDIASTKKTKRQRTDFVEYIIEPGDSISTIAEEFEVSVSTILWENNLSAYSIIRPGRVLSIPPVSGLNHTVKSGENLGSIAKKYDVEEEIILEFNKVSKNSILQVSQKLFIPGGRKISYPSYKPKTYTGFSAIKDIVKAPNSKPVQSNKMNWPTVGSKITQYYSWRHHGLDIANKLGTPIYAADAGIIEVAGWGTGYGNQLVINHGGGKKTRYAHLSKFFVSVGDKISKGQTIAAMGSTGWSTGSHLHFEVVINKKKYNPLDYIR